MQGPIRRLLQVICDKVNEDHLSSVSLSTGQSLCTQTHIQPFLTIPTHALHNFIQSRNHWGTEAAGRQIQPESPASDCVSQLGVTPSTVAHKGFVCTKRLFFFFCKCIRREIEYCLLFHLRNSSLILCRLQSRATISMNG